MDIKEEPAAKVQAVEVNNEVVRVPAGAQVKVRVSAALDYFL